MSTVPSKGMLIGRSSCGEVPSRSTWMASPATVSATAMRRSRSSGRGESMKPSMKPSARYVPSGSAAMRWRSIRSE